MKGNIRKIFNIVAGIVLLLLLVYSFIQGLIEVPKLDYSSAETPGVLLVDVIILILIILVVKNLCKEIKK